MSIYSMVTLTILFALTAFFVASELAIVKVRHSNLEKLTKSDKKAAQLVRKIISNLDDYLAACQLGITMTALGIGWLGGPAIATLINKYFLFLNLSSQITTLFSVGIAFFIITFVHVVISELTPKQIAVQKAETISLIVAKPLNIFYRLTFPITWLLNKTARLITRLLGVKVISELDMVHSEEELRILLSESFKSGEINQTEYKYVNNIFEFDNRIAKEIMIPRTEIISIDANHTVDTFLQTVHNEKYTRYPVIDGDKDHVLGLVNVKEVMTDLIVDSELANTKISNYIRPIIRVIDTTPIQILLVQMQKKRIHMAVLMDEYGGTSGLVTVEDVIEQIVGEIRDEFDSDEVPSIQKIADDHYIIDSKLLISEVNDLLNVNINDEDVDTIGGWILAENYLVKQGDTIQHENYYFKIIERTDNHIKTIEVYRNAEAIA